MGNVKIRALDLLFLAGVAGLFLGVSKSSYIISGSSMAVLIFCWFKLRSGK